VIEPGDEDALVDADVVDAEGTRLGSVSEVYRDDVSQRPEWVAVDLGSIRRFVPLRDADLVEGAVRIPYDRELVAAAPEFDPDAGQLRAQDNALLYDHYGLAHPLPFTGADDPSEEAAVNEGPLAPQAVRAYHTEDRPEDDLEEDDEPYAPAREGHLPSPDALRPGETSYGETARGEIQEIVDIEMSGEQLTAEQRAVRAHGEEHVVDMEAHPERRGENEPTTVAGGTPVPDAAASLGTRSEPLRPHSVAEGDESETAESDPVPSDPVASENVASEAVAAERHPVPHEQGGIPAAGTGADGSRLGNASTQSSAGTASLQDRFDDDAPAGEQFIVTDAGEHLRLPDKGGPA